MDAPDAPAASAGVGVTPEATPQSRAETPPPLTGGVPGVRPGSGAGASQPQTSGLAGAGGPSGVESSSGDYAPMPDRESSPVVSPRVPSPARVPTGGEGGAPERAAGGAFGRTAERGVVPGGSLATEEVEEIARVPPRSGPGEVRSGVHVGWFEDGERFEVNEAVEEEELKQLLDPLLHVSGLVKVGP